MKLELKTKLCFFIALGYLMLHQICSSSVTLHLYKMKPITASPIFTKSDSLGKHVTWCLEEDSFRGHLLERCGASQESW